MNTHPKWKYHFSRPAVIVEDEGAEEELGEGWFDTPAEALLAPDETDGDDEKMTEEQRLELLDMARSMELKPHHRLSGEKLLSLIQEERDRKAASKTE